MKTKYVAPIAEKLEFDYSQIVVASGEEEERRHGDMGVGNSKKDKGCNRVPGHNNGDNHGRGCF